MSDSDKPSFFEAVSEKVSEHYRHRMNEIDLVDNAVTVVFNMLPAEDASPIINTETDEIANAAVRAEAVQTEPDAPEVDISIVSNASTAQSTPSHLAEYEADARTKLAQAYDDVVVNDDDLREHLRAA